MGPAPVIRDDNYTMEVPNQTVDIIEAPRGEDRKPEGDNMVTSRRCETHMSCESINVPTGNMHQATHPGCGGVRGNVIGTHKDTGGPESHSRYRDDRPPERAFNGHKVG